MYKTITQCRACESTDLVEVFGFDRPMPLANDFVLPGQEHQGFVPVRVLFCRHCTLAQLGEVVSPDILYKNYLYVTSTSETMRRHFDRLLKDLGSENGRGTIVEVGSNDGLFLEYAQTQGFGPVVGIDPAENLDSHTNTLRVTDLFNVQSAKAALDMVNQADLIIARHCFCHQEWSTFMHAATAIANEKTLIAIEVPYALDLLRRAEFDTIYSEHTSFLTLKPVVALLKRFPFHLHAVVRYGIHGGCVLLMLRHNESGIEPNLSADEFLAEEHLTENSWTAFAEQVKHKIERIRDLVNELRRQDKIISAFGASAKGSMLINACRFTENEMQFVTDNSPLKPGRFVPGTRIPVIEEGEMLSRHPNYSIMTAWNFEKEICNKMDKWRIRGGKFIIPDNHLRVI